jgi:ATP-dependent exoDNAse (exonuclease V) alpha subunit
LPEDTTKFFSLNQECDAYNESSLNALPGEYNTYEAKITARRNKKEKEAIIRDIIAKPVLKLKVGAKVLAIYNDPEGQYVNGSTGVVTAMLPTKVEVLFDGRKIPTIIKKHD